jgi:hypothetical protein
MKSSGANTKKRRAGQGSARLSSFSFSSSSACKLLLAALLLSALLAGLWASSHLRAADQAHFSRLQVLTDQAQAAAAALSALQEAAVNSPPPATSSSASSSSSSSGDGGSSGGPPTLPELSTHSEPENTHPALSLPPQHSEAGEAAAGAAVSPVSRGVHE